MGTLRQSEAKRDTIAPRRTRYLTHLSNLMMVVMDFHDGPAAEPDPPHSHPHEQISYVSSGEINLFLDKDMVRLGPGDLFTVEPNVPHCIQVLTPEARLVDTFSPIRKDFLKSPD